MNVYEKFPQFIDSDPRCSRTTGYAVTQELTTKRHQALLPAQLIQGKSVLDIGCCVGSAGAWVLEAGAASYTGIELQHTLAAQAMENFKQCYPTHNWKVLETSHEEFFKNCSDHYDIIYAGGVIYSGLNYQEFLKEISARANIAVVIESGVPFTMMSRITAVDQDSEFYPITVYMTNGSMMHESKGDMIEIVGATPSVGAVKLLLDQYGFEFDQESYNQFKQLSEESYKKSRWGGIFYNTKTPTVKSAEARYRDPNKTTVIPWTDAIPAQWEFNADVAKTFPSHARKHIPDYDKVIDLSVNLCKMSVPLENPRIIDVGCATGETVSRLYNNNFRNIVGVDNSQAMLDQCNHDHGTFVLSDSFPVEHGPFDVVICNWTMHFMKDKLSYLRAIHNGLSESGMLILTEKTTNIGPDLILYHMFKALHGVSMAEIQAKANSLANAMFVDDVEWYITNLKDIGFSRITIVNAAPCFTTFLAYKTFQ